ncbi:MAG: AMP-binding protein [Microthrixaceae bacterium]
MRLNQIKRVEMALRRRATLGTLFDELGPVWGERVLVTEDGGETLTYRDAAIRVERWSAAIAARTAPGDRVVIAVPNGYPQFLLAVAASRAGAIAVPLNARMRPVEVDHVVADSEATLVVRDVAELRAGAPSGTAVVADPGEVAALFYTSGTTGMPKGARLTHRALVGQSLPFALAPVQLRDDELVAALPVAHIMGFVTLVGAAVSGVRVCFLDRFDAGRVLDVLEQRRSSAFIGVPAMYRMMEEAGAGDRDLSSVRVFMSGADVMPADLAHRFKGYGASACLPLVGAVGEAMFVEGYGMVEVGGGVAAKVSPPHVSLGVGDTVGFRLPGYRFRVVDEAGRRVRLGGLGELWVKGPGVLKGYWNAPGATADALTPDGWLRTGDLVRVGPLGTVMFCGRRKQTLKVGGYSVYPLEVETTLEQHPDVLEASVVGLPDERMGEVPAAVVRPRAGSGLDGAGLVAWAAERLAPYKAPRRVVVVDELPRTGTEKVQKDRLAALFGDG